MDQKGPRKKSSVVFAVYIGISKEYVAELVRCMSIQMTVDRRDGLQASTISRLSVAEKPFSE